jgi:hypothetical protein
LLDDAQVNQLPHTSWEFWGFLVQTAFMMYLAYVSRHNRENLSNLKTSMNHMREELVRTTASDSHAQGMADQRAKDALTPERRHEEIRGQL